MNQSEKAIPAIIPYIFELTEWLIVMQKELRQTYQRFHLLTLLLNPCAHTGTITFFGPRRSQLLLQSRCTTQTYPLTWFSEGRV